MPGTRYGTKKKLTKKRLTKKFVTDWTLWQTGQISHHA